MWRDSEKDAQTDREDRTDAAASDQGTGAASETLSMESRTLEQVQDALKRIADGTYGKCITCGQEIPAARLEAIPWTPYCLDHQGKLDGVKVRT